MTNTTMSPYPFELSEAVAPVRGRHRELIDAAVAWQQGRDRQTDPDHFALICAAAEHASDPDIAPTRWTRTGTYGAVRCDVPNWCASHGCEWPDAMVDAMWEWLTFLHATGRLDRGSDPLAELRKPLTCYGWLDQDGRPLPEGASRTVECECFLDYRETAELLGELVQLAERTGEDPLDPLRRLLGRETRTPDRWWDDLPTS